MRNDANKVMDTMFLLLTNSDCIYKQVVLWIKGDKIEEILEIMKGEVPTYIHVNCVCNRWRVHLVSTQVVLTRAKLRL